MKSTAKKKIFINNMITYCMVIAAWLIMLFLISGGDRNFHRSSGGGSFWDPYRYSGTAFKG